jgi:hypothetical protein
VEFETGIFKDVYGQFWVQVHKDIDVTVRVLLSPGHRSEYGGMPYAQAAQFGLVRPQDREDFRKCCHHLKDESNILVQREDGGAEA